MPERTVRQFLFFLHLQKTFSSLTSFFPDLINPSVHKTKSSLSFIYPRKFLFGLFCASLGFLKGLPGFYSRFSFLCFDDVVLKGAIYLEVLLVNIDCPPKAEYFDMSYHEHLANENCFAGEWKQITGSFVLAYVGV